MSGVEAGVGTELEPGPPDCSPAAIAAIRSHPRFEPACLHAATSIVELYGGHWVLNRVLSDRGRFMAALMMLDLDFQSGTGGGFTMAALRAEASGHGICSPGRITALLAAMQCLGLVRLLPRAPRQPRTLAPTERLIGFHRERFRRVFEGLAMVDPLGESGSAALWNPRFIGAVAHVMVGSYRNGWRALGPVPELARIAERDTGMVILFALLLAEEEGQRASIAAIGRRFSVSRAHVLTVMRDAEQAGVLRALGPQAGFAATPLLRDAVGRFFAGMFLMQRHAILHALRLCAGDAASAAA
jgi:hypothetical protein